MTTINQLVDWAKGIKQRFPEHQEEVWSLIFLCQDEIADQGSETHEVQLCYNDICNLVGIDE